MREFSASQLSGYLSETDSDPLLLDVREDWELAISRLEEALHIPMGDVPARLDELARPRVLAGEASLLPFQWPEDQPGQRVDVVFAPQPTPRNTQPPPRGVESAGEPTRGSRDADRA